MKSALVIDLKKNLRKKNFFRFIFLLLGVFFAAKKMGSFSKQKQLVCDDMLS